MVIAGGDGQQYERDVVLEEFRDGLRSIEMRLGDVAVFGPQKFIDGLRFSAFLGLRLAWHPDQLAPPLTSRFIWRRAPRICSAARFFSSLSSSAAFASSMFSGSMSTVP